MSRLTAEQEAALRVAEALASPPPWDIYQRRANADIAFIIMARNTMPALLAELTAVRDEKLAAQTRWVEVDRLNHKLLCDGAFSIDRDPMLLQPMLAMLQQGELSTGKAREVIRLWLAGEKTFDLPDIAGDDGNVDHVRAKLRETEDTHSRLKEAVLAIPLAAEVARDRVPAVLKAVNAALDVACGVRRGGDAG